MDFGNVDGDPRPRHPQQPQEVQPSWMSGDLERELSALIGPDLDFLRTQSAGLEEAKRAFITEERARHANFEERLKLESEQRLAVYAEQQQQTEGIALNRLRQELQTAEAVHAEQFQAAVLMTETAIVARENNIRAEFAEGLQTEDAQKREEIQQAINDQIRRVHTLEQFAQDEHRELLGRQRNELEAQAQQRSSRNMRKWVSKNRNSGLGPTKLWLLKGTT